MTENEAIEEVKFNMSRIGLNENTAKRVTEARDIAIQALEEIQQYRAIGTVEEVKSIVYIGKWGYKKGYNEAIDEFAERLKEKYGCLGYIDEIKFEEVDKIAEQLKAGGKNE